MSKSKKLFNESEDSDNELEFKTNENYAEYYKKTRKRELLQKFKDRGLHMSESELESDSESSDEAEEANDPQFDEEFFKTLAKLKSKDPAIYDKNTRFFENDEAEKQYKTKEKPITLKDYERKVLLETGGEFSDEDETEKRAASPTIAEEERQLKEEFKKVIANDDDDDDDEEDFGGFLKKREKTKEERAAEEADYLKWLAENKELAPLKQYWGNDRLPRNEQFLRDYILNKGYTNTNSNEIPTYEEIIGENEPLPLSEDEQELEKMEEFEHKYNFRFEEPDAEFIKRYPRTIENSVRRTDDKRKQKRRELKERKEAEKAQKMKELEMIKEMKRQEIEEKLSLLKKVTGNEELGIRDDELEEDFDPAAHDKRMQELFDDNYYAVDEGEEKPECPSDIEDLKYEDWDNFNPKDDDDDGGEDYEPHCEDEDFNMDCEYDPAAEAAASKEQLQQELIENTRSRRGRKGKRRNRFMEMIKAEKPKFDPNDEKSYAEYLEEYYKLDCEDFIGDLPCRFKYVETTPNDFGLTIEEILLAKNKELNRWASLKKAIQIRPENVEQKERRLFKLKAKNEELKRKIFKSLYGEGSDDEENEEEKAEEEKEVKSEETEKPAEATAAAAVAENGEKPKKKKKKKRKAAVVSEAPAMSNDGPPETKKAKLVNKIEKTTTNNNNGPSATKKAKTNPFAAKKFNKNVHQKQMVNKNSDDISNKISNERIKAYGINPRKFHKKQKYGKKNN